jgi:O-antigen/teichoic acid export membrane protein
VSQAARSAGASVSVNAAGSSSRSRLIRNIGFLAGGQLATWSLSLLYTVVVPRALGPGRVGQLTIAFAVTGIVGVAASLGITTLMVKEIGRDHQNAPALVGTALLVRAVFVVPSIVAVGIFVFLGRFSADQTSLIWLATASMIVALFVGPFQAAFQGIERMEFLTYTDILNKAVLSVASIAIVLMGLGVHALMALGLAMTAVVLALNALWSRGKFAINWQPDRERMRSLIVGSLPYWTTGLVLTFYMWVDSMMLSVMSSDVVVGWYSVPTRVFTTLLFVPVILGTAMLPRLSSAFRDGIESLRRTARPALELALVLSLPVAIGAALVAKPLIADIWGPKFAPSTWVLVILALTLPPTYFNIMANQVLIAINRQVAWTKVMVAAALINPVLNLFLIRYFQDTQHNGAIGAALSLTVTEIGMALAGLALMQAMFDAGSVLRLLRAIAATAGMAIVVWALSGYGLIIETAGGMFAFAALAVAFRLLTTDEFAMLRRTAARAATRTNGRGGRYSTRHYQGWDDITARPLGRR